MRFAVLLLIIIAGAAVAGHESGSTTGEGNGTVSVAILDDCRDVGEAFDINVEWAGAETRTEKVYAEWYVAGHGGQAGQAIAKTGWSADLPDAVAGSKTYSVTLNFSANWRIYAEIVDGANLVRAETWILVPSCDTGRVPVENGTSATGSANGATVGVRVLSKCVDVGRPLDVELNQSNAGPFRHIHLQAPDWADRDTFSDPFAIAHSINWTDKNGLTTWSFVPDLTGTWEFTLDGGTSAEAGPWAQAFIDVPSGDCTEPPPATGGGGAVEAKECSGVKMLWCNAATLATGIIGLGVLGASLVVRRERPAALPEVPIIGAGVTATMAFVSFLLREPWLWGWMP